MVGSWLALGPLIIAAVVVLMCCGALVCLAVGWRGLDVALGAPTMGAMAILSVGVLVGVAGMTWSPLVAAGWLLLLAGAARLVSWRVLGQPETGTAAQARQWWTAAAVGAVLGFLGTCGPMVVGIPSPGALNQLPDTFFHASAAKLMAQIGSGSLLDAGRVIWTAPVLYPGGFQALAATIVAWGGVDPVVACHVLMLISMGVIFPTGVMLLARWLGGGPIALAGSGAAAAAFGFFPFWIAGAGPAWSNLLGVAFIPTTLAVVAMLTPRVPREAAAMVPLLLVLVAAACSLVGSQPNALYGAALLGFPLAIGRVLFSASGRRRRTMWAGILVGVALSAVLVTVLMPLRSMMEVSSPELLNFRYALLVGLKLGEVPLAFQAPVIALEVIGAMYCLRRGNPGLVVGLIVVWGLFAAAGVVPPELMRQITWPWWNSMARIIAIAAIPAAVLAGFGCEAPTSALASAAVWVRRLVPLGAVVAIVISVSLNAPGQVQLLNGWYAPSKTDAGWTVTNGELAALRELGQHIPEGSTVAMNPWLGGEYLYLVTDRHTIFPQIGLGGRNAAADLVGTSVDRIVDDSAVCVAAADLRVGYVITGGRVKRVPAGEAAWYSGIERVGRNAVFTPVAKAGDFVLWAVPACR